MSKDKVRVVYRCKDEAESNRRAARANILIGAPFLRLPDNPPEHKVLLVTKDGSKIRRAEVEMVFNDMCLMDAISNWGENGPLYKDTLDERHAEVLSFALEAYKHVPLGRYAKPELL